MSIAIVGKGKKSPQMKNVNIPNEINYQIFSVDNQDEQGVINTWNQIWKLEDNQKISRSYLYDYEKYYIDGKIEIYIGIK